MRIIFLLALTIILAVTLANAQESSGNASIDPEHTFRSEPLRDNSGVVANSETTLKLQPSCWLRCMANQFQTEW